VSKFRERFVGLSSSQKRLRPRRAQSRKPPGVERWTLDQVPGEILSVKALSRVLGIGLNQAYEAVHAGQVPAKRINSRFLIPKAALRIWLGERARGDIDNE